MQIPKYIIEILCACLFLSEKGILKSAPEGMKLSSFSFFRVCRDINFKQRFSLCENKKCAVGSLSNLEDHYDFSSSTLSSLLAVKER